VKKLQTTFLDHLTNLIVQEEVWRIKNVETNI
jgi:hypothetical protein